VLILSMLFEVFQPRSREQDSVCATHLMVTGRSFMDRDANVKRACLAAENVDAAAGHSRMLPILVLGPGEKPWRVPPGSDFSG
jgi:hypothetical protein